MTRLTLITAKQYKPGINEIGDIISIHDDAKRLDSAKYQDFTIVELDLEKENLQLFIPQTKRYFKSKTLDWTEEPPVEIQCWQDKDGSMKRIVNDPKYKLRYYAGIISETYSRYAENHEIIVDKDREVVG